MPKTNNDKRILEEFDELEVMRVVNGKEIFEPLLLDDHTEKVITDFISKALQQAREEERKEIYDKINKDITEAIRVNKDVEELSSKLFMIIIRLLSSVDKPIDNKS